jgi:hemerythrin-like metal-binding protein
VTGSFGAAELQPGEGIEGLLHRADAALYRAKNGGRNRVECADAEVSAAVAREATVASPGREPRSGTAIYAETGFTPIDEDHRTLSAALEDFVKTVLTGQAEQIQPALEAVIAGVGTHFREEERLMEEFDYPLQKRHQETHALFVGDAVGFLEELKQDGVTLSFRRWAVGRLVEWFRLHVLAYDVGLGQFLLKAGAVEGAGH